MYSLQNNQRMYALPKNGHFSHVGEVCMCQGAYNYVFIRHDGIWALLNVTIQINHLRQIYIVPIYECIFDQRWRLLIRGFKPEVAKLQFSYTTQNNKSYTNSYKPKKRFGNDLNLQGMTLKFSKM